MAKFVIILLVGLMFEATGVVYLSSGLKQVGEPASISAGEIGRLIKRGATNSRILLGVFFEAIFFGVLLYLLSRNDVSFIWPLTSLGFVVTGLSARFILGEQVTLLRWSGILLIVAGAALVSLSERSKQPVPAPATPATLTPPQ